MHGNGVDAVIQEAARRGPRARSEHAGKRMLEACGIPVTEETPVAAEDAAVDTTARLGYPVVVKECGASLTHKCDRRLVALNLPDASAVCAAIQELRRKPGDNEYEGFLVQPMLRGKRGVIVGGLRDALFGPSVRLGGIWVEALTDIGFRPAPLGERDALEMTNEIRGCAPGPFLRARDQLMTGSFRQDSGRDTARLKQQFHALFEPSRVAIIGASESPLKWVFRILFNTRSCGYKGALYAVNPKYREILGTAFYPSVSAIPGGVDLALIVLPPALVLDGVRECTSTGVRAVVVITAGFEELDDASAYRQEARDCRLRHRAFRLRAVAKRSHSRNGTLGRVRLPEPGECGENARQ